VNGPSEDLRSEVRFEIDEIVAAQPNEPRNVTPQTEDRLTGILGRIADALEAEPVGEDDNPQDLLDATDEWAGLISYAVSRVYAPASPWPFGLGGWGRGPVRGLRRASELLQRPLAQAATALRANGFSVSVAFPWGASVGLSWPIPVIAPKENATATTTESPVEDPVKASSARARRRQQRLKDEAPRLKILPDPVTKTPGAGD
jgi:hypothetical protein